MSLIIGYLHPFSNGMCTYRNGDVGWYVNGILHREDGPAFITIEETKFWYINNQRHRIDGPAVEYVDGTKMWYINGEQIDCKTNEEFLRIVKLRAFW